MASAGFTQSNYDVRNEFQVTVKNIPFPTAAVSYYLDEFLNVLLENRRKHCMSVCREIVYDWTDFRDGLSSCSPIIFRLDTEPELIGSLSIIIALVRFAVSDVIPHRNPRLPCLAYFGDRMVIGEGARAPHALPVEVLIGLTV